MINNITMSLMQLERTKKSSIHQDMNFLRLGTLFFYTKMISGFNLIYFLIIWATAMNTEEPRV